MDQTEEKSGVEKARELMDQVLIELRAERALNQQFGARELSEAITCLETGCMWMIRSQFAELPYSPLTRLKKDE